MVEKTTITVFDVDPSELRADDEDDDAVSLSNDILTLINEEYDYLDPSGVSVHVNGIPTDDAADFPTDEQ